MAPSAEGSLAAPSSAEEADRGSLHAALALALTLPGDTVLYLLLPLYAATFGVSLPEAGVLLAANRLVRIVGYQWIARLYARHGPRGACVLASCGAVLATLSYSTLSGLWPLLAGRLLWGLSYAALNLANQALPTSVVEDQARRTGRSRAIIAMGPMLGLVGGALVALAFGPRVVFMLLTAIGCLAPLLAARIPIARHAEKPVAGGPTFAWPGPISIWSFAMGFTMDGLFVFGLGLLAAASYPKGAVLAAAVAMALRYAVEVLFSPVGGHLAHRYGARRILVLASLGAAGGLSMLASDGWLLWTGVLVTIVLRALTQPLTAPLVAEAHPGSERVPALARQATWRDIGAGTGPLAAGLLFPLLPPVSIYGFAAILLAATSLLLLRISAGSAAGTAAASQSATARPGQGGGA
ncbi:MAG: MFS transporter [Hyphomicrobiaceae bacterium]